MTVGAALGSIIKHIGEKSEDDVLVAMRTLTVREGNMIVARVRLYKIKESQSMPTGLGFGDRQVSVGTVHSKCDATIEYTEAILQDVLCHRLADSEI